MHFIYIDTKIPVRRYKDKFISSKATSGKTKISILRSTDFAIIRNELIQEEAFLVSIVGANAILYHFSKPDYYFIYQIESGVIEKVNDRHVSEFVWNNDLILNLDRKDACYAVFDSNGNLINQFQTQPRLGYRWFNSGIIKVKRFQKENNWIECLDPIDNSVRWHRNFEWEIARLETHEHLIVLEYLAYDNIRTDKGYEGERDWYNPDRYTIVLDGDTGVEIWRYSNGYHQIDYEKGIVLIGNINSRLPSGKIESLSVVELKIRDGNVLSEVEVRPAIERVPNFHFVDESGIYYTSHDGSFGKISKTDGTILWEFDLIDNKGEKRKLSDWLLLGNGNLVLQAMPNHPNGDLTCKFNPEENLEYSKVMDGRRIS